MKKSTPGKLKFLTYEELYKLYWVENKSIKEISLIYDCSTSSLFMRMKKLDLPKRDSASATRFAICGEKHPNWNGGISSLKDVIRGLPEYKSWKNACYKRDQFKCVLCEDTNVKFNIDHIKSFSLILQENNIKTVEEAILCKEIWDINNGRVLCVSCHKDTPSYGVKPKLINKSISTF